MSNKFKNFNKCKQKFYEEYKKILEELLSDYPFVGVNICNIRFEVEKELSFLLSSIPKNKSLRYKVCNDKWGDLFWRYPFDDTYRLYSQSGSSLINNLKEVNTSQRKIKYSEYSGSLIELDFNKIEKLLEKRLNEFLKLAKEYCNIKKSYEANYRNPYHSGCATKEDKENNIVLVEESGAIYVNGSLFFNTFKMPVIYNRGDLKSSIDAINTKIKEHYEDADMQFIIDQEDIILRKLEIINEERKSIIDKYNKLLELLKKENISIKLLKGI